MSESRIECRSVKEAENSDVLVKRMFVSDESWPGKILVKCPFCGFEYVHWGNPTVQDSDKYTAWSGRGSCLRIPMWCEDGHSWRLAVGFHKGNTVMFIEGSGCLVNGAQCKG